jgi:hypothetical protein
MARIRSIKPETWSDQRLARLSRDARLLYIALWNFADEQARMVGDPRQVKGMCLPMDDDLGPGEVDVLLEELAKAGRVIRYTVDEEHFLFLPHLPKHQRLDTGQASRFPEPPDHDSAPPPQNPAPTAGKSGEVRGESGEVQSDPGEVQPRAHAYGAGSREHVAGVPSLVPSAADVPPLTVVGSRPSPNNQTQREGKARTPGRRPRVPRHPTDPFVVERTRQIRDTQGPEAAMAYLRTVGENFGTEDKAAQLHRLEAWMANHPESEAT